MRFWPLIEHMRPHKIISGGQTGADQGGLDGAKHIGIPTGGMVPKGCRTDAGPNYRLIADYGVTEHHDWRYPPRTKANVLEADGTVWVGNVGSPGYYCTRGADVALPVRKHWIENPTPEALREWVITHRIRTLNVAGNRESKNPGVFEKARILIVEAFK